MNKMGFEEVKGFMPPHEGNALLRWAKNFQKLVQFLK